MNNHAERLLEFNTIREECIEYCRSEEGREYLRAESVESDPAVIRKKKARAVQFRQSLESGEAFPDIFFPPVSDLVPRIRKEGAVLEGAELAAVGGFIRAARDLKKFLDKTVHDGLLHEESDRIPDLDQLAREIFRFLDAEGAIKEKEVPALKAIRDRMKALHAEIGNITNGYLQNTSMQPYWQSSTPTLRQGRTVLPMKANFKGRVRGIVHEVSASGATVFIEPLDIVERNNELVEQDGKYRQEMLKVLRELTMRVREKHPEFTALIEAVSILDSIYARARYAVIHTCIEAKESESGLVLLGARHPILGKTAVPIDIMIGASTTMVIITGPNTGGKTVSLKTVGLFALMNQFGLEIPAREGSALPFFDDVLADIGDEQSIEQSLSTFSAHMRNISGIVRSSTGRSLVLLDELGSGTDPEEGSALAMSILDHFLEKSCLSIITTHHGILKNYGYTRTGVENACVEFDAKNLSPTYRIVVGIPGESHAVDIASRNGITDDIIARARGYLSDERTDVGRLIRNLSEKQYELYEKEKTHGEREQELREQRRLTDLRELKLKQQERELRSRGVTDLNRFIDDSRKMLENLVKELREGELTKDKTRAVKDFIQRMSDAAGDEQTRIDELSGVSEAGATEPDSVLEPGKDVMVRSTGRRGTLVRKVKNGMWIISFGSVKVTMPESGIRIASGKAPDTSVVEISVSELERDNNPVFELDVRGMRLEEALDAVRNQIDRALFKGLGSFGIIHGKGEGILQRGIREYLSGLKSVKEFHFPRPEEGGFGKTIVVLG